MEMAFSRDFEGGGREQKQAMRTEQLTACLTAGPLGRQPNRHCTAGEQPRPAQASCEGRVPHPLHELPVSPPRKHHHLASPI